MVSAYGIAQGLGYETVCELIIHPSSLEATGT